MGEAKILLRDAADLTAAVPAEVERKLSVPELLWNDGFVRKSVIIIFLALAWEIYGTVLNNPLLFPTFHDTILTMFDKVRDGTIPMRAWASLKVLFMGYASGIALAAIFTILAISTRIGTDFLETITAMFNPLPAIALLPCKRGARDRGVSARGRLEPASDAPLYWPPGTRGGVPCPGFLL